MKSKPRRKSNPLVTPVLPKTGVEMPWPEGERHFFVLAREGLFRCRQHEFFRSCVKAENGPSELASQRPFFEPRFPEIPAAIVEQAVGFFSRIAEIHGSEAAALLVWDRAERRVRLVVPRQTATMGGSTPAWRYPVGVHYDPPADLPEEWVVFGDIHCHVGYAAYASHTDIEDELHSAGLHIVVGRISDEPPEFHVEAVVDGQRFVLEPDSVMGGYERRRTNVPKRWIERVEIEQYKWRTYAPSVATAYEVS